MNTELNEIIVLLTEIRAAQREALTISRRVAEESLANQREAIRRQEQAAQIIRRAVVFALLVIALIAVFLVKLRMENYRF